MRSLSLPSKHGKYRHGIRVSVTFLSSGPNSAARFNGVFISVDVTATSAACAFQFSLFLEFTTTSLTLRAFIGEWKNSAGSSCIELVNFDALLFPSVSARELLKLMLLLLLFMLLLVAIVFALGDIILVISFERNTELGQGGEEGSVSANREKGDFVNGECGFWL